jgi:hypothetical protein
VSFFEEVEGIVFLRLFGGPPPSEVEAFPKSEIFPERRTSEHGFLEKIINRKRSAKTPKKLIPPKPHCPRNISLFFDFSKFTTPVIAKKK